MKKKLLLLTIAALVVAPLAANGGKRKHFGGKRKDFTSTARNDYRKTFNDINTNASALSVADKETLIQNLHTYFTTTEHPQIGHIYESSAAGTIYTDATKTFDELKKFETAKVARKAAAHKKLGIEGRKKLAQGHRGGGKKYSPSIHFAQKVLGTILLPNPIQIKMGPGPVKTNPALRLRPIRGSLTRTDQ